MKACVTILIAIAGLLASSATAQTNDGWRPGNVVIHGGQAVVFVPGLNTYTSGPVTTPLQTLAKRPTHMAVAQRTDLKKEAMVLWSDSQLPFDAQRFQYSQNNYCIVPGGEGFAGYKTVLGYIGNVCIYAIDGYELSTRYTITADVLVSAMAEFFISRDVQDYAYVEYVALQGTTGFTCARDAKGACVIEGMIVPMARPPGQILDFRQEVAARGGQAERNFVRAIVGIAAGSIIAGLATPTNPLESKSCWNPRFEIYERC